MDYIFRKLDSGTVVVGVELRIISGYLWETICFWRRGYVFGGGIVVFVWIISVGFHGLFKTGIY
jgi:hypothetical protein